MDTYLRRWVTKIGDAGEIKKLLCHKQISLSFLRFLIKNRSKLFTKGCKSLVEAQRIISVFIEAFLIIFLVNRR